MEPTQSRLASSRSERTRLRYLTEFAPVGVAELDEDGRLLSANEGLLALLDLGAQTPPVGAPFELLLHPDDRPAFRSALLSVARADSDFEDFEARLIGPDEGGIDVRLQVGGLDEPRARYLVQALDITARKKSQALVGEETRLFEMIARREPLDAILAQLIRSVSALTENRPAALLSANSNGDLLSLTASAHLPAELASGMQLLPFGENGGSCGVAARDRRAVFVYDLSRDEVGGPLRELAERSHLRSCWSTPIMNSRGRTLGAIALFSAEPNYPGHYEVYLVERAVHIAGIAMESAHSERALRASEERLALAFAGARDGIWDWDLVSGDVYISARWNAIVGLPDGDETLRQEQLIDLLHPDDRERFRRELNLHLETDESRFEIEHRIRRANGEYFWALTRGAAVRDAHGVTVRMAGSMTDISERRLYEERLEYQATHDALTRLPNRTLFSRRLDEAISRSLAGDSRIFAVFFVDLDRFKVVNDSLGHQFGDRLLVEAAARLRQLFGADAMAARLGGDEFTALAENVEDEVEAAIIAERIIRALSEPYVIGGVEATVSASVGASLSTHGYRSANEILRDADVALYRAKYAGRSRAILFDKAMRDEAERAYAIEQYVRAHLRAGTIRLFFQPIVHAADGSIAAYEGLLRFEGAEHPPAPIDRIIEIAEESGLILQIGEAALEQACAFLAELGRRGLKGRRVCVNVSAHQLRAANFLAQTASAIEAHHIRPELLELEITESSLLTEEERAADLLRGLRKLGVRISIDDFGTGYSSLRYLKRLPIDTVKLDRSFVAGLPQDRDGAAITDAVIALAHQMGLEVIAEGVERADQHEYLRERRCDLLQGYLFGKPAPREQAWSPAGV